MCPVKIVTSISAEVAVLVLITKPILDGIGFWVVVYNTRMSSYSSFGEIAFTTLVNRPSKQPLVKINMHVKGSDVFTASQHLHSATFSWFQQYILL